MIGRKYLVQDLYLALPITKRTCYRWVAAGFSRQRMVELRREISGELILRPSDISKVLGIHRSNIFRWFHEGRFEGFKLGKLLFIFKSSFMEFMVQYCSDMACDDYYLKVDAIFTELCEARQKRKVRTRKAKPLISLEKIDLRKSRNSSS